MEQQLIFVYNAKGGFMHGVTDLIKKSASPKTYPCKLCQITYSGATMNKIWKNYIASLNISSVFLHKNEFEQAYPNTAIKYPAVLLKNANSVKTIISSEDFDKVSDLGDLMKQMNKSHKMPKIDKTQLYRCVECGLHYADEEIAKKCAAWCSKYKSCNLEITKLSEEVKAQ